MKFVPAERPADTKLVRRGDNIVTIQAFLDSGLDCARIIDYPHKDTKSCASALRAAVLRTPFPNVRVIQRGNDVYLTRVV